jgi:hypothetical protein
MPFEPSQYMRKLSRSQKLKGKNGQEEWFTVESDYLDVKWRLVWLREVAPDAVVTTDCIERTDTFALFRAAVTLPTGGHATGWGSETKADFGDFIEKAETKALGRALAALGFGTQHAAELDEGGSIADAPVEPKAKPATSAAAGAPISPLPSTNLATHGVMYEQAKGRENPPAPAKPTAQERWSTDVAGTDTERDEAAAKLRTAGKDKGMKASDLVDLARQAWPHITTKEDFGTLTAFQLGRLTGVVTGEDIIDAHGKIVPAPEQATIAAELSAAMRS